MGGEQRGTRARRGLLRLLTAGGFAAAGWCVLAAGGSASAETGSASADPVGGLLAPATSAVSSTLGHTPAPVARAVGKTVTSAVGRTAAPVTGPAGRALTPATGTAGEVFAPATGTGGMAITPVTGKVGTTIAPVTGNGGTAVAPIGSAAGGVLAPVGTALAPITGSLAPVGRALAPVTATLAPVTRPLAPVTGAILPVGAGQRPGCAGDPTAPVTRPGPADPARSGVPARPVPGPPVLRGITPGASAAAATVATTRPAYEARRTPPGSVARGGVTTDPTRPHRRAPAGPLPVDAPLAGALQLSGGASALPVTGRADARISTAGRGTLPDRGSPRERAYERSFSPD